MITEWRNFAKELSRNIQHLFKTWLRQRSKCISWFWISNCRILVHFERYFCSLATYCISKKSFCPQRGSCPPLDPPLDPFSQSFHGMKVFCVQMIDMDLFFRYLKGRCHGNQFCEKNGKRPTFVALAFRHGMGYRYLNVRINSVNDASISCKNFVNFDPVTPELTELICERWKDSENWSSKSWDIWLNMPVFCHVVKKVYKWAPFSLELLDQSSRNFYTI